MKKITEGILRTIEDTILASGTTVYDISGAVGDIQVIITTAGTVTFSAEIGASTGTLTGITVGQLSTITAGFDSITVVETGGVSGVTVAIKYLEGY